MCPVLPRRAMGFLDGRHRGRVERTGYCAGRALLIR